MGEPCALRIFLGAAAAPRSLEQSTILRTHLSASTTLPKSLLIYDGTELLHDSAGAFAAE